MATPIVATHPLRPEIAGQGDTAVARQHRGHRLGLLLKIDMMRWLAEAEPQLKIIQTWNNVDNSVHDQRQRGAGLPALARLQHVRT